MSVKIEGFDVLGRRLQALEKKLQGKVLIKAARAGAAKIRDRARELAPQDSGGLARHGIVSIDTARKYSYAECSVTHAPRYFYGKFQELGVAPGTRRKGGKRWGEKRRTDSRRFYFHPGHKAQPHLRPAADESESAVVNVVSGVLSVAIVEAMR